LRSLIEARAVVATTLLAVVQLLTGCGGGGGGGGSGGNGSSGPGLTVSTTSVQVTADAGTPSNPTGTFTITVSNAPSSGVSIGGDFTQNAILSVDLTQTSDTTATVNIHFQNPSIIGPGTYNDTLTLGICTDDNCTALISGTRRDISVRYTVTGQRPPQPTVIASRTFVSVEAPPFLATSPSETVTLTVQGASTSNIQMNWTQTNVGLLFVSVIPVGNDGYEISLNFRSSAELGVGTFNDTVTITLCQFNFCPIGLDGSPVVINTQYRVSETVSGPNGYTIRQVAATASDIVWDAVGGNIYLTTPSSAPTDPNSVVALDPVTRTLGTAVFAGSDPTFPAVSNDGQFLYVGFSGSNTIKRFLLPGLQEDIVLPLGNYPSGPLFAGEIQVFPGQPHSVAVSRSANEGFPGGYDVAIFDDAVARPNALHSDTVAIPSIQFGATPDVLYGGDGYITTMSIDANGVNLISTVNFTQSFGAARIHFDSGVLYTQRGQAIDPVAGTLIGTFDIDTHAGHFGLAAAPDSDVSRIFFLVSTGFRYEIRSYDLTTFAPIATIRLDSVQFPFNRPLRIIRWGPDGLALPTGDGRILLITGPFVRP
jgi:hypothetical protein